MSSAFIEALHSPNLFASHSVDNNNKLHVSTAMYGRSMVHPIPDLEHINFFMCMGSNPVVSQMSMIQLPNALERLQSIEARGGRVVIVDPRRTETAQKVGEHVSIQPQTDAYLLMAMLHVIAHEDGIDLEPAKAVAHGVDEFVASPPPGPPSASPRSPGSTPRPSASWRAPTETPMARPSTCRPASTWARSDRSRTGCSRGST